MDVSADALLRHKVQHSLNSLGTAVKLLTGDGVRVGIRNLPEVDVEILGSVIINCVESSSMLRLTYVSTYIYRAQASAGSHNMFLLQMLPLDDLVHFGHRCCYQP
jgi:hypothetical protein